MWTLDILKKASLKSAGQWVIEWELMDAHPEQKEDFVSKMSGLAVKIPELESSFTAVDNALNGYAEKYLPAPIPGVEYTVPEEMLNTPVPDEVNDAISKFMEISEELFWSYQAQDLLDRVQLVDSISSLSAT